MVFQCKIPEWFGQVLDWFLVNNITKDTFDKAVDYLFNEGIVICMEMVSV